MSTVEDKLVAGIQQVKNTTRSRRTSTKTAAVGEIPAALSADNMPTSAPTKAPTVAPIATAAPTVAPRVYLNDDRVWPD